MRLYVIDGGTESVLFTDEGCNVARQACTRDPA
jgi:hypothetical protein